MVRTSELGQKRRWFARARARAQSGETLIETMCTLVVVSLGIIALVTAMGYDFAWGRQSRASAVEDDAIDA